MTLDNDKYVDTKRIFEYTNYRKFIKDFYVENKKKDKSFSYKIFSKNADIKSKSYFSDVQKGNKDISNRIISKVSTALGLKGRK